MTSTTLLLMTAITNHAPDEVARILDETPDLVRNVPCYYEAIKSGNVETVEAFLERDPEKSIDAMIEDQPDPNSTPMYLAFQNVAMSQLLLDWGHYIDEPIDYDDCFTALQLICLVGDEMDQNSINYLELLLENEADPQASWKDNSLAIYLAIETGKMTFVRRLLEYGAEIDLDWIVDSPYHDEIEEWMQEQHDYVLK